MIKCFFKTIRYLLSISLCLLIGCATEKIRQHQPFDFSTVGQLKLELDGIDHDLNPEEISKQVADNLLSWNYPIGKGDSEAFSHKLIVKVGDVAYGSTPAGFSFSSGNSDPRALDFQKTDVLPISCQLTSLTHPDQTTELTMGFTAKQSKLLPLGKDKLADRISTVCFNLLHEIKWPLQNDQSQATSSTSKTPSWMPEVRIEEAKPAPNTKTPSPGSTVLPEEEPKRDLIIHNQGNPVIFHWGQER